MNATFAVCTLGCKVNQYESQAITEKLEAAGLTALPFHDIADVYLINTCSVTAEGERKARQMIRRAHQLNPDAHVILTGCYAQVAAKKLAAIEGVSYICGNTSKLQAVDAALALLSGELTAVDKPFVKVEELSDAPFEQMTISHSERTRAYVKIEDGCESKCAYCIIPSARGPIRSKPIEDAVSEIAALTAAGYREVVLTGIEISAYGKEFPKSAEGEHPLITLLGRLDAIEGLERIRLGSLEPSLLTPAFSEKLLAIKHLAPQFHLSLQSGCDKTLAAMRRRYNTAMVRRNVDYIRAHCPDACFTADIIVGFPGETDEDFAVTSAFLESLDLLSFHIFPYSRRPGTEADRMPDQLPEPVKRARVQALEKVRAESTERLLSAEVGKRASVLFEENSGSFAIGHTASLIEVAVETDQPMHNVIADVRFVGIDNGRLIGALI